MFSLVTSVRSADTRGFFIPTTRFSQSFRSAFINPKSIEIGNADIAANVLGCAAKVPSFSFSVLRYFAGNIELRPGCIRFFLSIYPRNRRAPAPCQFEESLRNAVDANGQHQRAKIQAMLIYYSSRMEAVSFFRAIGPRLFFRCCRWVMGLTPVF